MKQYFILQCKRLSRSLAGGFLVMILLLGGLAAVLTGVMDTQASKAENQKVQIGVVGSLDDPFLQMGVQAITTYDSSRFAMTLVPMEEAQAKKDLATGKISAYVVVPEGFVDSALNGDIKPLTYVSTLGGTGLNSVVQKEITQSISDLLVSGQKTVYGMYAVTSQEKLYRSGDMDSLALKYAEYILVRDQVYSVQTLGVSQGQDLGSYLLCGFTVLLMMLGSLPFAWQMVGKDRSLGQMLCARGKSPFAQTAWDFIAYALMQLLMVLAVLVLCLLVPNLRDFGKLLLRAIPVAILGAAMSYLLYQLASDLISGVLLQFFVSLALCFVSGCLYPVYFFPSGVQKMAAWLPTGAARSLLAGSFMGLTVTLGYSLVFFLLGSLVGCRKIRGGSR